MINFTVKLDSCELVCFDTKDVTDHSGLCVLWFNLGNDYTVRVVNPRLNMFILMLNVDILSIIQNVSASFYLSLSVLLEAHG